MKKTNKITPFYVINEDINAKEFKKYNVMPYFVNCYNETKVKERPKTFEEFRSFVERKSIYMYWSRCQYEIVLKSLIGFAEDEKIDVDWQVKMNIDLITELLMQNVKAV